MIRATLGFVAIVTAAVIAVQLPAILNGWTVAAWYGALMLLVTGVLNVAVAIVDEVEL